MKAGAADFLRKSDLTGERLVRAVEDAVREQDARRTATDAASPAFLRTVRLDAQRIGTPLRRPPR